MKKKFALGIILLTTLSLAACDNTAKSSSTTKKDTSSVVQKKKGTKKVNKTSSETSSETSRSTDSTSSSATSSIEDTVSSSSDSAASRSTTTDNTNIVADSSTTSAASSSSESIEPITFDEAATLIQKGGFTDFNPDSAKQYSVGSHQTADGGFVMITYPGAKGKDIFTLTPHSDGSVFITAQYGSAEGGFTLLEDQSMYGPSSATVQR